MYLFGGKTGQSVDFAAHNGADLCESQPDSKFQIAPPEVDGVLYIFTQRIKNTSFFHRNACWTLLAVLHA